MSEIIHHNNPEDIADLPDHPIPAVSGLDVMVTKTNGCADLVVVIADPIDGSAFSQQRLITKAQNYFDFINSESYIEQVGASPSIEKTRVLIKIHPESSDIYTELIENCQDWAHENNTSIELYLLTEDELGN